jgi:hypothetical protein
MMIATDTPAQSRLLLEAGEPFAAGLCECPEATPFERYARAYRRWFEDGPLAAYESGHLYPGGPKAVTLPWWIGRSLKMRSSIPSSTKI